MVRLRTNHGHGSSDRLGQDVRRRGRREQPELRGEGRGVPHAPRAQRLRQDHHAQARRRARAPRSGRDLRRRPCAVRRRVGTVRAAGAARHGHGLPELRDLAAHDGLRERRVPASRAARAARGDSRPGHGHPRHGGSGRPARQAGADAVRRPAAAGGARAGAGVEPGSAAAGRAALEPGRAAARRDAVRAPGDAGQARHHQHLRDARPGRGDDAVGSHRRHERRSHRAGRRARGRLPAAEHALRDGLPGPGQPSARARAPR